MIGKELGETKIIERKFVETKLGEICYFQGGRGRNTLVFLHGFLGSPHVFNLESVVCRPKFKDYRLVAPYFPGHGQSFMLPAGFTFRDLVSVTEDFWDRVKDPSEDGRTLFIGHSLGGAVCWEMAMRSDISRAILIDPGLGALNKFRRQRLMADLFREVSIDFPDKSRLYACRELVFGQSRVTARQLLHADRLARLLFSTTVTAGTFPSNTEVAVLWGEKDMTTPAADYESILKSAGVGVKFFPGAHHWFMAQPESYFSELEKFL